MAKFLGMLERGWDVHVVCQTTNAGEWQRFPGLKLTSSVRKRVHRSWKHRPRWLAIALLPVALLTCIVHNSQGTWDYLRMGWSQIGVDVLRRLYLDATALALRPDIIHFEFGSQAVGKTHLKQAQNCKTVVSFRGYDLNFVGLDEADYYRDVFENTDCVHVLGEDLWRRAQSRGCDSTQLHFLIPPAVDTSFFSPSRKEMPRPVGTIERPLRVLSVGRLEWKKGYEYALQAIRILCDRGIHCRYQIIGEGSHLEAIAFERHQLGLTDTVQLLGPLERDKIRQKLMKADVLMHAATSEGFCNAVLEAQAMEVPIVCSNAGGLAENVVDKETGFVVGKRDPKAMADRLSQLAADPQMRRRMGQAGRRRVLERFTLDRQFDALDEMYRRVLSDTSFDM